MPSIIALDLINSAARLAGIVASGEVLGPDEANDAISTLNDLVEAWNLQNFMIYNHVTSTFPLTANVKDYTIGTGGVFNTSRPVGIRSGYCTLNSVDYPLLVIGDAEYDGIWLKSLTNSYPVAVTNDGAFPLATLSFWPLPAQNMTVSLTMDLQFSNAVTLATTLSYPPGYSKALRYDIIGNIKVANLPDDVLTFDAAFVYPQLNRGYQIL
jgi:hypothetical protein